jgi:hypothetical protein
VFQFQLAGRYHEAVDNCFAKKKTVLQNIFLAYRVRESGVGGKQNRPKNLNPAAGRCRLMT